MHTVTLLLASEIDRTNKPNVCINITLSYSVLLLPSHSLTYVLAFLSLCLSPSLWFSLFFFRKHLDPIPTLLSQW